MIYRTLCSCLLLLCSLLCQQLFAIGEWQIYNGSSSFQQGTIFDNKIYALAGQSLCSFDLDDENHQFDEFSRITGLSGSAITYIQATRDGRYLCLAYANGDIDLLDGDGHIWNIPDLANKPLTESKEVTSIIEGEDNKLYLSGEFGFLRIDPAQKMILQAVQNRKEIDFAFHFGNYSYRVSHTLGLERCAATANEADLSHWQIAKVDGRSLKVIDAKVFESNGQLLCWLIGADTHIYQVAADGEISEVGELGQCQAIHPLHNLVLIAGNGFLALSDPIEQTFSVSRQQPYIACNQFFSDQDSSFYAIHDHYGILPCDVADYVPDANLSFQTDVDLALVPGGIGTYYLGSLQLDAQGDVVGIARRSPIGNAFSLTTSLGGCISRFYHQADRWINTDVQNIVSRLTYRASFNGLTSMAIDPIHEDRYAIGSWLFGLYIIDHDTLLCRYDEQNTGGGIQAFDPTYSSTRVNAVTYDDEGRLFFTNSLQDTILRCLTPEGEFIKYPNPGFSGVSDACRILLAQHDGIGLKWVLNDYGYQKSRIGLYYGEPTAAGAGNYQTAWFNQLVDQDNNEYLPNYIYTLCEDLDGRVWVLTNLGPFAIDHPDQTFNHAQQHPGQGKVRRVKIPRNDGTNLADYLMVSTDCSCMVIDNFNRKWIGTKGAGLYLLSADCITEIEHFDSSNSPLLSDDILDLCYDHDSGLLYISCEGGVLTYQTDAINGEDEMQGIYCFPNPVRPDYYGELRIMGLMNDSQVSITTANGNLIYHTQSQGATATWDLRTTDGSRVEPGIYLIHGIDSEGKNGKICKFLVL